MHTGLSRPFFACVRFFFYICNPETTIKKVDKHTLQINKKNNYRMHKIGKALLLLCSLTSAGEIAAQTVSGKLIDENRKLKL